MKTELKIRIKSPSISIKNGFIAETHSVFNTQDPESKDEETAKYGIRRIANNVACTISPWSLLGWLRSGVTEYLISEGISVCHGMDVTNVTKSNKEYSLMVEHDLEHGYHKKRMGSGNKDKNELPECEAIKGEQCIVSKMFGGFTSHHRIFSLMPVKITPIKSHYESGVRNITGLGNYRNLAVSPRAVVDQSPFTTHKVDTIANLDAIMYLKMYEDNPLYTALIMRSIEYLNRQEIEQNYNHQLGGAKTFGNGWIETSFLPPNLTQEEITKYHLLLIKKEEKAEDSEGFPKQITEKIQKWEEEKVKLNAELDKELIRQKEIFGIDKKWWNQKI